MQMLESYAKYDSIRLNLCCMYTHGDSDGQGSLACDSQWGHKESDITWGLNNNNIHGKF